MNKKQATFAFLAIAQTACYLFLFSLGNLKNNIIACEAGFIIAFLCYVVSLLLLGLQKKDTSQSPASFENSLFTIGILFSALCFRLIMWNSPPSLSDDIYRYIWEGKMCSHGINPFILPPSDPNLSQFRDALIYPSINNKNLQAIYPPLSQFVFTAVVFFSPTIKAMNLAFLLFDIATIIIMLYTLKALNLPLLRIIIYCWNPLIIMEFAGNGHADSVGIFFLMLALYLFVKRKSVLSILALAFSALGKLLPLIFLPFVLRGKKFISLLVFTAIIAVSYAPFLSAGKQLLTSLMIYAKNWAFNGSFYDLLTLLYPKHVRCTAGVIFLCLLTSLFVWYQLRVPKHNRCSIYFCGLAALGSLYILTPVLHPWYVCWIVPFLVIYPNRALLLLSGSVFLSYWVLKEYSETGIWKENFLIKVIEYVPFYWFIILDGAKKIKHHVAKITMQACIS